MLAYNENFCQPDENSVNVDHDFRVLLLAYIILNRIKV